MLAIFIWSLKLLKRFWAWYKVYAKRVLKDPRQVFRFKNYPYEEVEQEREKKNGE